MRKACLFFSVLAAAGALAAPAVASAEPDALWVLREIGGRAAIADARTTLRVGDGVITGSGGCNSYSGAGRMAEGRVRVGLLMMTKMGCAPEILEQEAAFASALPRAARYELDHAGRMIVYDAHGRISMRLVRAH